MIDSILDGLGAFFSRPAWGVVLDLADIGLVALLIYRVLLLVRGTRAMQMGIGLAFVFLIYELARRLGLVTVWSILDAVVTYLVLIIVVIFQSDIRRALMRVGRGPLWRASTSARETHVFEEVIKACSNLAQKRVGALIVFERGASLEEFIEPGTELDAAVSKELLFSVFVPSYENPMHDGAVIIREGRIAQAGAFLPLTASPKIRPESRHPAPRRDRDHRGDRRRRRRGLGRARLDQLVRERQHHPGPRRCIASRGSARALLPGSEDHGPEGAFAEDTIRRAPPRE